MAHECPRCGRATTDDWPVEVDGAVVDGGCLDCWEALLCNKLWGAGNEVPPRLAALLKGWLAETKTKGGK